MDLRFTYKARTKRCFVPLLGLFVLMAAGQLPADEHPSGGSEHPMGANGVRSCSVNDVAGSAKKWVQTVTKKSGYLEIYDPVQKKELFLTLMRVHRDHLSKLGPHSYFVCADFKGKDGKVYDIDLFMKGENPDSLEADGMPTIHKVGGVPRYTWVERGGLWVKAPMHKASASTPRANKP